MAESSLSERWQFRSRFLHGAETNPPPPTGNKTGAVTDAVSGYVSVSLAAYTTKQSQDIYENLKVQCVKRNLELKKNKKRMHTNE